MKIGVFVGSFNPVHEGHMKVVNYILDKDIVDKIFVIPTMPYWDKDNFAPLEDRINMLRFYENDRIIVDSDHNNYPYTYLLMEALKKEYPNEEFMLIIGADNIVSFDKWKNYQDLLEYKIIVLNRDDIDINKYIDKFDKKDNFIVLKDFPYIAISSTEIKDDIDESSNLNPKVYQYIKAHHLYEKESK